MSYLLYLLYYSKLTEEIKKKKKIRVKMQSLLIKMINRLIREEIIPVEAVNVVTAETWIAIRCLVAPSAMPVIMLRCERIGVGNVTGTVWAVPLETSLVPPASGKKEIDQWVILGKNDNVEITATTSQDGASTVPSVGNTTAPTSPIAEEEDAEEYEDAEEVSDSDDNEEEDEVKSIPSMVSIPFLPAERKQQLLEAIIQARKEWRDTSSRVRVLQVVEEVNAGASLTFDYLMFVTCAAWIAAMGLGTNSSATVIASMLVSPIMGPVMGLTFGTTVKKKDLIIKGLVNERKRKLTFYPLPLQQ